MTRLARPDQPWPDGQALPHDDAAELALLGAVVIDPCLARRAPGLVRASDFYTRAHALIFEALGRLVAAGTAIDVVTLKAELAGRLDEVGGPAALAELVVSVPRSANIEHYARIIREKSHRRTLVLLSEGVREAAKGTCSERDLAELAEGLRDAIAEGPRQGAGHFTLKQTALEGVLDPAAGRVAYVLDPIIPEAAQTIIAASWKTGKTLALYQMALAAAFGTAVFGRFACEPTAVAVLQLEMPAREDLRRLRRIVLAMGRDPKEIVTAQRDGLLHFFNSREINFHSNPGHALVIRDYCREREVRLLVVDSLGALYAGLDFNDGSQVRLAHGRAMQPILDAGVAVVPMHHHSKAGMDGHVDDRVALLGSQSWGAVSDRIYTLRRVGATQLTRECEAGEFFVNLSLTGSWSPTTFDDLLLHVYDDELGGTVVEAADRDRELTEASPRRQERVVLNLLAGGKLSREAAKLHGLSHDQLKRASTRLRKRGWMTGTTSGDTDSRQITEEGRGELARRIEAFGTPEADS